MRPIGFSTGAIALGDFARAMGMLRGKGFTAIELSALREEELPPLVAALDTLDLEGYRYVSVHAPSHLQQWSEKDLLRHLTAVAERRYPIIVHPDVIRSYRSWVPFGDLICIENMDKRKARGRSVSELMDVFSELPKASFCLDLGHAHQVDPTMSIVMELMDAFGSKLRQLHVSAVNTCSRHEPLNLGIVNAFARIADRIPPNTPIILESMVLERQLRPEAVTATRALDAHASAMA